MTRIDPSKLTELRYQFDNQVTEADILTWIYNFEEKDWGYAIRLLEEVQFFSESRCGEILRDKLKAIFDKYSANHLYIMPVGAVGKSGHMIAYPINKLIEKKPYADKCTLVSIDGKIDGGKNNVLVLLDDFSGSGSSISDFHKVIKDELPDNMKVCVLTVAYMSRAKRRLRQDNLEIFGLEQIPAFSQRKSVFGYPLNMRKMRDFAYRYGEAMFRKNTSKKISEYTGPLGYANSQSLVCFHHTTPNNSLPILWSNRIYKGKRWFPLFPRFENDRIDKGGTYERRKYYWSSLLQKLGLRLPYCTSINYSKDKIRLIGIVHYKHQTRSDAFICNKLGLIQEEYEHLLAEGIHLNLFDKNYNLTPEGSLIYETIRKADKNNNSSRKPHQQPLEMSLYIPNWFLGLPRNHAISELPKMDIPLEVL